MTTRAKLSPALQSIRALARVSVAPVSASLTTSEDRVLATDKAKEEATAALKSAAELHQRVKNATTKTLLDAAQTRFAAAWEAAFEALEAHDSTSIVAA